MATPGTPTPRYRGGRPKGSPNKLTRNIREAIEKAFHEVGGAEYLAQLARDDPRTFVPLLGKLLPMQLTGGDGPPIRSETRDAGHSESLQRIDALVRTVAALGATASHAAAREDGPLLLAPSCDAAHGRRESVAARPDS